MVGERGGEGGSTAILDWMATTGHTLPHRPDIVIPGPAPCTWTLIDVKTVDPAGDTLLAHHHTDGVRGAAHAHAERLCAQRDYGTLPDGMSLVGFSISAFGSIGDAGLDLISQLSRRVCGALPYLLSP